MTWTGPAALIGLFFANVAFCEPMTGAEFEAYSTGKTLFYGANGVTYGAEQYLAGRRVIWTYLDGQCQYGSWHEAGTQICFTYENADDGPQCWEFFQEDDGLRAEFLNNPENTPLVEIEQSSTPLQCLGPKVGV